MKCERKNTRKSQESVRLLVLPATVVLLGISIIPLIMLVVFSFVDGNVTIASGISGFTFKNFLLAFSTDTVPKLIGKSFYIAIVVTILCIFIAYPAAWSIAKVIDSKYRNAFVMCAIVPALVSQLLLIFAIMQVFQSGGILMTFMEKIGICKSTDTIVYTTKAVIVVLVYEYLPYMILCLYSCLEKIDNNVINAAKTLGASRVRIFFDIILPQSFSGLLTGILVTLIPVAGSFVEPNIIGGPYGMMVGSMINTQFNTTLNMGYGAALSFILLILMVIVLTIINSAIKYTERKIGG